MRLSKGRLAEWKRATATALTLAALAAMMWVAGADRAQAADRGKLLKEARTLAALQKDYFAKRQAGKWKSLYAYQHPQFQKKVSLEEYKFFEGRVVHDYRDTADQHVSGGLMPSLAYIKKNPEKKDALGFPAPRSYRWFTNPFVKVNGYTLEKVSISEDGRHAMVVGKLKAREQLNPALVRDNIAFDVEESHIDYWEKVKGRWRIALLAHAASISGSKVKYLIPSQSPLWEKKKFVHFQAASLKKQKR